MSLALLEQHPILRSVVIDIPNVCTIGRKIAEKTSVVNRITFQAIDFIQDDLPTDFDMILQCDAGIYTEWFFRKLYNSLKKDRNLVIVDWWYRGLTDSQPAPKSSFQYLLGRFDTFLGNPNIETTTKDQIINLLSKTGYKEISEQNLEDGTIIIRAKKL